MSFLSTFNEILELPENLDQIITPSKLEFNNLDDKGSLASVGQVFSSPEALEDDEDDDPVLELNRLNRDRNLSRYSVLVL